VRGECRIRQKARPEGRAAGASRAGEGGAAIDVEVLVDGPVAVVVLAVAGLEGPGLAARSAVVAVAAAGRAAVPVEVEPVVLEARAA